MSIEDLWTICIGTDNSDLGGVRDCGGPGEIGQVRRVSWFLGERLQAAREEASTPRGGSGAPSMEAAQDW